MDKKEFATLAIAIKAAYPASKVLQDTSSMDFWYQMLCDLDYRVAENAITEHICTNVFPPNIAEIRKLCTDRLLHDIPSSDEAWGMVQKAIAKHGYYNPLDAFATMDETTVDIVKNLGWSNLCNSTNQMADRANFRMAYESKIEKKKIDRQLPEFVSERKLQLKNHYAPSAIECEPEQRVIEEKSLIERNELTDERKEELDNRLADMRKRFGINGQAGDTSKL